MKPTESELQAVVKEAFNSFDTDNSGYLEREEIRKLLNEVVSDQGQSISDDELNEVIMAVDANGDGKFSFSELYTIIGPILTELLG